MTTRPQNPSRSDPEANLPGSTPGREAPGEPLELNLEQLAELVARLSALAEDGGKDTFPHPTGETRHLETHISHVLLTGDFAYKFKKPVDFGFLDFSTAARRAHFCAEEIRLNRRTAPDIYLDVARVTGSWREPRIDGDGPVLTQAVRMRRFNDALLLDHMLEQGEVDTLHAEAMAEAVARMHASAQACDTEQPQGSPGAVWNPVQRNFDVLDGLSCVSALRPRLAMLRMAARGMHERLEGFLTRRKVDGFIRECHGDLHLGNMAWIDEHAVPFDAIEFSPELRWIDVMSDAAFTTMDLEARGEPGLAATFISHYLDQTLDYAGAVGLRFYQAYRAMVRAKVTGLLLEQDGDRDRHDAIIGHYLDLAARYLAAEPAEGTGPELFITRGASGCGKSTLAHRVTLLKGAVRIRSDRVRHSLEESTDRYDPDQRQRVYRAMADHARGLLESGLSVVIDATFLAKAQRQPFFDLARSLRVPCRIIDIQAPADLLKSRIQARIAKGTDPSEAYPDLVDSQLSSADPLTEQEHQSTWTLDATDFQTAIRVLDAYLSEG
ncbi:MAG: AAA family ATPase [Gammaproteobacteria bacterium]